MKAVLFISHGSRLPQTAEEIRAFVLRLKERTHVPIFEFAFLDVAHPTIPEGIDVCAKKGATEIIVLLNFLNAGRHVDEDIPRIVAAAQKKYPRIIFHITEPLGQHSRIADLFLDMIKKSLQREPH